MQEALQIYQLLAGLAKPTFCAHLPPLKFPGRRLWGRGREGRILFSLLPQGMRFMVSVRIGIEKPRYKTLLSQEDHSLTLGQSLSVQLSTSGRAG